MNRFSGKVVVVTGAASGFGEAIARRFAAEGASVCLSDIDVERLERVAAELGRGDGPVECVVADVSQEDDVRKLVETAHTTFGALDVLVNNAGYSHRSQLMWQISVADFDAVFAVNVRGVFLGCKHAIPHMIDQGGGVIINIASIGAVAPRPGVTPYNATKGAVLTLSRGLALEVARHNIRVNAVNPVAAATGFMKGAMGVDELSADQRAALVSTIPRGRLAEPRDVAAAVTFLASDEADMITGTSIDVDGGRSI